MKHRQKAPPMTKAELRAQAEQAMASLTKPIVKLPTKVTRQCGRCGEFTHVMVDPGEETPAFKCKVCDRPSKAKEA
jgi:hypothetical protein